MLLARHAPGLVDRAVAARVRHSLRTQEFDGAGLAAGLRERHGLPAAGVRPGRRGARRTPTGGPPMPDVTVAIIGTGFGGIGMAVSLLRAGITDVVLLERAADLGGTWRDNSYPGAACDVPSHLYSFSFAPNPDWSRSFSPQPEIWAYLRRVAAEEGVTGKIRFGEEVTSARWDAAGSPVARRDKLGRADGAVPGHPRRDR